MGQVIAAVTDLIFATKISATAKSLGIDVTMAATESAMSDALARHAANLVLVDMSLDRELAVRLIRTAAAAEVRPEIIAFFSHVQADLKHAAEQAGADAILTRSVFSAELPSILSRHCQPDE